MRLYVFAPRNIAFFRYHLLGGYVQCPCLFLILSPITLSLPFLHRAHANRSLGLPAYTSPTPSSCVPWRRIRLSLMTLIQLPSIAF
ncbi:hypothetical protein BD311DRAFT_156101 [Dichomitus squalens]|uniref:Uncharacterized protein n=1 Tax=Dichomitus squalens TaxID=114155 RepID=A0A4Q9M8K7_9APHY|nr:hypothetical protein BD311DRAFT_156101 [Dichomitus squalens]